MIQARVGAGVGLDCLGEDLQEPRTFQRALIMVYERYVASGWGLLSSC